MPSSDATEHSSPPAPERTPAQTLLDYTTLGPHAWMLSEVEQFFGYGIDDPAQRRIATLSAMASAQANYNTFAASSVEPGALLGCEIEVVRAEAAPARSFFTTLPNPIELLEVLIHNAEPGDTVSVRQIMAGSSSAFATQIWPFGLSVAESMVAPRTAAVRAAAQQGNTVTARTIRLNSHTSLSFEKRHGPPKWRSPVLRSTRADDAHSRSITLGWRYTSYVLTVIRHT
jgi:hypothetical protein